MNPFFKAQLESFLAHVQKVMDDNTTAHGAHCPAEPMHIEDGGRKYARIHRSRENSIYAFIDKATGDILYPATWRAPAKGVRGNIGQPATWTCVGPYGIAYLKDLKKS